MLNEDMVSADPFATRCDGDELDIMRIALEAATDAIIVHTEAGELVYFNEAAARGARLSREEFAALPPWGFSQQPEHVRLALLDQLRDQGFVWFLAHKALADGSETVEEIHCRMVDTARGRLIVASVRDVTERARAEEMLRNLAFHDSLTGLANRTLLDDRLAVALASARRHSELLGIAFVDIDDFKPINDRFGHAFGDQVLQIVGKRLTHAVRESDTVARVGGDEFVVVLPRLESNDSLFPAAQKLAEAIAQPIELPAGDVDITASIGIAYFKPDEDDARSLLMKADFGMYEAKRLGIGIMEIDDLCR